VALALATYLATPGLGRRMLRLRIFGIDVHKHSRPRIPQMGGIAILVPLIALIAYMYYITADVNLLFVLASTIFFGAYGLLDDLKQLGKYQKLALSASIGLVMLVPVSPPLATAFLLLVLVVGMGNIFNLFAGFNGMEVGCSTIAALFFSVICLLTGNIVPFYLSLGATLIMLGFLAHNKYPARIFPGNVGTFTIGGFFAGICLYYNLFYLMVPLLALHIVDMSLKAVSAGYFSSSEKKPTRINGDNILVPRDDYLSLSRFVLKIKPMTESRLVALLWSMSFLVGVSVLVAGVLL
jgi:UDP-N-acetylglucosamine--dolichyl-phosphate N-acetylglucosaminephosphotransferase